MSKYERFAMILDSDASVLANSAVRLLELGIDVLYANDVDEAALLARQESGRLGAVLVPASFDRASVDALLSRICSQLDAGPRSLIATGPQPPPEVLEHLRDRGVVWCLWDPHTIRDLRFVVSAAMSAEHDGERRKQVRVPTEMATTVCMGRHRKEVTVHDISLTGAYFATEHPFLEGSQINAEIPLPDRAVLTKAVVVNAKTADKPGRADVPDGMGVAFTDFGPGGSEALRRFIDGWIRRFRL